LASGSARAARADGAGANGESAVSVGDNGGRLRGFGVCLFVLD
jgi:hypothetical protein